MYATTLKAAAQRRGYNQSALAKTAHVTRQRVSQWFLQAGPDDFINAKASSVKYLAEALGMSADDLLKPLPVIGDQEARERLTALLLWDKLYPDLLTLFSAALDREPVAIARMVHGFGLFATARLVGPVVWRQFPSYKKYLNPALRRGLEPVWTFRQSLRKA